MLTASKYNVICGYTW